MKMLKALRDHLKERNIDDPKANYKRIYIVIIDNILNECRDSYKNLKDLKFFELLSSENFHNYSSNFPIELVTDFVNSYKLHNFHLDRLVNELKCMYKSNKFRDLGIYNIIEYLYENSLHTVFPEILRLAKLIVTVPASSASTERSFSSLKRIHTYLRNTQAQQRLTDLSMISIEKNLLVEMKIRDNGQSLSYATNLFLFDYRSSPQRSTGVTPAKLMLGRELRNRFSLLRPPPMRDTIYNKQTKPTTALNSREVNFHIGQKVMVRDYRKGSKPWTQGIIIEESVPGITYIIDVNGTHIWKRHVNQMIECNPGLGEGILSPVTSVTDP